MTKKKIVEEFLGKFKQRTPAAPPPSSKVTATVSRRLHFTSRAKPLKWTLNGMTPNGMVMMKSS